MKRILLLLMLVLLGVSFLNAQAERGTGVDITGLILDIDTDSPVEYTNVILKSKKDSTIVNGAMSDINGIFRIEKVKKGKYFLEIKFIGYETYVVKSLQVTPQKSKIDIGNIPLKKSVITMEGIEVEADRPIINYEIDRKVIDVRKQATSESGTAVELLENVPSVEVDFDGNVTLRGSSSFTVMIDGRPSILDASDALQMIPASTIAQIELITNPSVKYDPEGMAGIINIITVKRQLLGTSGLVNVNMGNNNQMGGDFLVNWKKDKFSYYVKGIYKSGERPGEQINEKRTETDTYIFQLNSSGSRYFNREFMGLQGGIDYFPNDKTNYRLGIKTGQFNMIRGSELDYVDSRTNKLDNTVTRRDFFSVGESERLGEYYSVSLDYTKKFMGEGHKISGNLNYRYRTGDENSFSEEFENNILIDGQQNLESGPSKRVKYRADYERPLSENSKFEAGIEGHTGFISDITGTSNFDSSSQIYIEDGSLARDVDYTRSINGAYALYNNKLGQLGLQSGLRVEHTYRYVYSVKDSTDTDINRLDWFPSFHTSYKLPNEDEVIASYSRRIQRPRGYYLEPFQTHTDVRNVWQGNPDLLPTYTNSIEAGYKKNLGKNVLYVDIFHKKSINAHERISMPLTESLYLNTIQNVGDSYSTGLESSLNLSIFKIWSIFWTYSIYDYQITGDYKDVNGNSIAVDRGSTNWNTRISNTLRISKALQFQTATRYHAASASSQGEMKPMLTTDFSAKYTIIKNTLTANFQVRDIFDTGAHEYTVSNPDLGYESYTRSTRGGPSFSLALKYNFNNFKEKRSSRGNGGDDMEEDF